MVEMIITRMYISKHNFKKVQQNDLSIQLLPQYLGPLGLLRRQGLGQAAHHLLDLLGHVLVAGLQEIDEEERAAVAAHPGGRAVLVEGLQQEVGEQGAAGGAVLVVGDNLEQEFV